MEVPLGGSICDPTRGLFFYMCISAEVISCPECGVTFGRNRSNKYGEIGGSIGRLYAMILYKDFLLHGNVTKLVILIVYIDHVIVRGDFRMAILTAS